MTARRTVLLAVSLAAVAATPATAATAKKAKPKPPPPVCNLVTDDTGDTFAFRSQDTTPTRGTPKEDGFDVVTGDIASDGKVVTAVIRVKKLTASIQTSPQGQGFAFDFLLPNSDFAASLRAVFINGQAPYYEATYKDPSVPNSPSTFLGLATGMTVPAKNEVHITAPVALFAPVGPIKIGTRITPAGDSATSGRAVPPSPGTKDQPVATRFLFADVALGGKSYVVGTKSCVTPGR